MKPLLYISAITVTAILSTTPLAAQTATKPAVTQAKPATAKPAPIKTPTVVTESKTNTAPAQAPTVGFTITKEQNEALHKHQESYAARIMGVATDKTLTQAQRTEQLRVLNKQRTEDLKKIFTADELGQINQLQAKTAQERLRNQPTIPPKATPKTQSPY